MSTTYSSRDALPIAGIKRYVSPTFLLRVAGLSIDTVDALSCVETTNWAHQVISLETKLEEKRERLLEALHQAVHVYAANPEKQRILLKLKRDIFNRRAPKDGSKANQAGDCLSVLDRSLLDDWLGQRRSLSQLLQEGQRILEEELQVLRVSLKSTVQDESFRKGLLLSSATLERDIDHYLKAPNNRLNRRLRLVERSLLLYLLRTACKTSPFSTFASVGCGSFAEAPGGGGVSGVCFGIDSLDKQSFIQLNVGILTRLSALLLACPDIFHSLPVHINPGWDILGDRLRYMRRKITLASAGEPFDKVEESFFCLPLSPTLTHLIDLLEQGREIEVGALANELAITEGSEGDESDGETNIEMFLSHLLRLGLLVAPNLHVPLSLEDPLSHFRQRVEKIDNPVSTAVAAHLQRIETHIRDYALAAVAERRQLLDQVNQEVASCYTELAGDKREIPHTLLYEDATIAANRMTISPLAWEAAIQDLQDIQNLLPIFDMMVINKRVMNGYYKLIHGKGQRTDDVLAFAEVFSQDYYKEFLRAMMRPQFDEEGNRAPSPNHFQVPEIGVVNEARRAFAECVSQSLSMMPAASDELVLTREPLRALADGIPQTLSRLRSDSFFCQIAHTEENHRLIINHVYNGLTQMSSRFVYPLERQSEENLAGKLQETLEEVQPAGAVFAELSGASETNLNLHPSVTRYELLFPGEQSLRPAEDQIPIADLFIQHDPHRDCLRLYSKRLGKEVIPLYLGQLLQTTLSDLRQVMLNFSYASFPMLDLWSGVKGAPVLTDTVTFFPRIVYGNLVLQRAMWKAPAEDVPVRLLNQSDADYFLTVTRWQRQHSIARKVFVSPDLSRPRSTETEKPQEDGENHEAKPDREAGAEQLILKPMYVDFENYFTVLLFERAIARSSFGLILTEMLPDERQLALHHDDRSYVTELVIEINRRQEEGDSV